MLLFLTVDELQRATLLYEESNAIHYQASPLTGCKSATLMSFHKMPNRLEGSMHGASSIITFIEPVTVCFIQTNPESQKRGLELRSPRAKRSYLGLMIGSCTINPIILVCPTSSAHLLPLQLCYYSLKTIFEDSCLQERVRNPV